MREPINPAKRVLFIPRQGTPYTGPYSDTVEAFAASIGERAVVYPTGEQAEEARSTLVDSTIEQSLG
jgi:hypothetical protein